ncbi:MAG TPA: tetratricopeptide repeat protein [Chloroflexota bacterium]|nr:tetratricopeptide repeat protein [Chloroflexota bacterium]HUM69723.1 tetratricopeptide repeat protein [Chloroflexota bacterium]
MSSPSKWQEIRLRQGITNAERWLTTLESHPQPFQLVLQEYDNLLRAIEYTLTSEESFDLAYRLIHILHTYAMSYADWDRWLIYVQKAHLFSQLLNRKCEEAALLDMMGNIHRAQGDFKKAEICLNQALALYKQLGLFPAYAMSLSNLAVVLEALGQDGLDTCQTALTTANEHKDDEALARIMLNLSHIYMRRHEWSAGLQAAQTSYDVARRLHDTVYETRSLFNVITCLGRLGKWDEVNVAFMQLEDDLVQRGDTYTLAKLRNNLGLTAFKLHNLPMAEQQWQEALKLQSLLQDPVDEAFLYNNLGMVYTQTGELDTAKEMLQKAIERQEELQDIYQWANAMDNLAEVHEAQGDTAVARQIRQQAHTRLQTLPPTSQTQALLTALQTKI